MGDKQSRLSDEGEGREGSRESEEEVPSESEILARLLHSLGQCPGQSLPLSKILARLPAQLRSKADAENVCAWLRRFPGILEVSGPKGEEQVMLTVGKLPEKGPQGPERPEGEKAAAPAPAPVGPVPNGTAEEKPERSEKEPKEEKEKEKDSKDRDKPEKDKLTEKEKKELNAVVGDDDNLNPASVQLRGLPFKAAVADVQTFLGDHMRFLSPVKDNIRLLSNRDGRPSGFARVFFVSPQAAHKCRDALHKKKMGDRYIEVLACADRRGRRKAEDFIKEPALAAAALDAASESEEKERVLQECRDHMSVPGRQQILLSMLGIALSEPARAYLRRANLGLKHFLARFPGEFTVDGPKGCEKVIWMRADIDMGDMASMLGPTENALSWAFPGGQGGQEPSTPDKRIVSPSAKPPSSHGHFFAATPSDWGTPAQHNSVPGVPGPLGPLMDMENFPAWPYPGQGQDMPMLDFSEFTPGGWPGYSWPPYSPWGPMPWLDNAPPKGPKKKVPDGTSLRSHAHLHPQSHPFANRTVEEMEKETDDKTGVAALRLRGLPFSVTVQDVLAFFAQHDVADLIHDGPGSAHLLPKANGRPSGQAVVQMRSRRDAEIAQKALNHQWVGSRYIEVFVYGEESEEDLKDSKDFNEI
mmetsp:Transcript_40875/g.94897  ORF Transcript_40875/g.94897 Transcript_40875/m.94897 type:complete len:642 (-) Transcript_40875:34-1959(-)